MKTLCVLLAALAMALPLSAQQLPVTTITSNVFQHTVMATINGNQSRIISVNNGVTLHQVTFQSGPGTTSTFTVYASNNNSPAFNQVGVSTLNSGTISFFGVYDQIKITTTGYTGTGDINADYYGETAASASISLTAGPFNTPVGAVGDAMKVYAYGLTDVNGIILTANAPDIAGAVALSSAATSTLAATVFNIKTGAGNLYGYDLYNAAAAACFVQVFNLPAASVTLGTTTPNFFLGMATLTKDVLPPSMAILSTSVGFSAASTTTATGSTPCATPGPANFFYK